MMLRNGARSGLDVDERRANCDFKKDVGVPVWKLMWCRYIPRRKFAITDCACLELAEEISRVWRIAFRVSGAEVGSVASDCRTTVEEWESMLLQSSEVSDKEGPGGWVEREGGLAACIALARAMVRLPCPVPASKISKGGRREEESLGCRGGAT